MGRTLLFVRLAKVTLLEGGRSPVSLHAQELHANKQPDRCKSMFENGKVIRWSKMENGESGMQLLLPIPPKLPPLESATSRLPSSLALSLSCSYNCLQTSP